VISGTTIGEQAAQVAFGDAALIGTEWKRDERLPESRQKQVGRGREKFERGVGRQCGRSCEVENRLSSFESWVWGDRRRVQVCGCLAMVIGDH
jgi:hypothetical protein